MEYYIENIFGAGNYKITGENAEVAAKEYKEVLEKVFSELLKNNNFEIENMFVGMVDNATSEIISKHKVQIDLVI